MRQKIDTDPGVDKQMQLEANLREAEKRNNELMREIKALQKIQNDQSKALEKITNTNDYVQKVKNLMDELRWAKERIREVEEKSKRDDKTIKSQHEHLIRLEEQCKSLKIQNGELLNGGVTTLAKP